MDEGSIPVKYVIYSHYTYQDDVDFKAFQKGKRPEDLDGVRHLASHFRGLRELLISPGHQGLLVLFYAPGYEKFLDLLARGEDHQRVLENEDDVVERERLHFASAVASCVRAKLIEEKLGARVRFLTSQDLSIILGRVNAISAGQFRTFFLGPAKGIHYDSPKVVEAILRLRALGTGVPVLRLDHDVLFRGIQNRDLDDLGLFKAVACAVRAYQMRLAELSVSTFLFSASYNSQALLYPPPGMDRFEAWSRAFATRIYPALVAEPDQLRHICDLPEDMAEQKELKKSRWNDYLATHLDDSLARKFYGLKEDGNRLEVNGTAGITSIGAHPLHSVISGALLCLSDGAILDLPPYSNFGTNVMWIDDHLKYSLHRAMKHFTSGDTLNLEPGLSDARLDDVTVTKARPPVGNLLFYIFEIYLPTLLWGTVMDAWITAEPILKCRLATLDETDSSDWFRARDNQEEAPLPHAMLEALRIGHFDPDSQRSLRRKLEKTAIVRIEEVRQLWTQLKTDGPPEKNTFASYWAHGTVEEVFGRAYFSKSDDELWKGIAAPGRTINSIGDLSVPVALKLRDLIEDAVSYVHWTLEWPKVVQIVRSIRAGSFMGDLGWEPK